MKKIFLLLFVSSLSACSNGFYKFTANDIQYIEDQRSGLCFAIVNSRSTGQKIAMTKVDCNDVEELLPDDSSVVARTNNSPSIANKYSYFSNRRTFSTF